MQGRRDGFGSCRWAKRAATDNLMEHRHNQEAGFLHLISPTHPSTHPHLAMGATTGACLVPGAANLAARAARASALRFTSVGPLGPLAAASAAAATFCGRVGGEGVGGWVGAAQGKGWMVR